ncbi:hypothetical protein LH464_21855 [Neorhizobium sp. T786]|uniref:hypothetical protein n=1 Tax=Pseudorhizobium xiangyangii TaxID=2883104 RepID=UPI001CFFA2C2|nr:hypothetical protein [Neorhizobium xiangyangii]MCB5205116.1 hypothetical protein [Neorhizobium xiangyangii]
MTHPSYNGAYGFRSGATNHCRHDSIRIIVARPLYYRQVMRRIMRNCWIEPLYVGKRLEEGKSIMDASAGVGLARQSLEALKAVPGWLLSAATLALSAVYFWPPFWNMIPTDIRGYVPLATTIIAIFTFSKLGNDIRISRAQRRACVAHRNRERLFNLYRPLAALFMTRHMTMVEARAYPNLRSRIIHAWDELGFYRKRSVGIRHAMKALFDRGISTGAEMDYYCDYPMKQIVEIVEANGSHVSAGLMLLVARADRSRHEDPGQTGITDEEIALFNHISKRHEYLSQRYD